MAQPLSEIYEEFKKTETYKNLINSYGSFNLQDYKKEANDYFSKAGYTPQDVISYIRNTFSLNKEN